METIIISGGGRGADEKKQSVKNVVNAGSGTEGFSQETTM